MLKETYRKRIPAGLPEQNGAYVRSAFHLSTYKVCRGTGRTAVAVLAALILSAISLFAQPSNDNIGSAKGIGGLPFSDVVDSRTATTELGEPFISDGWGNTLWYVLTPSSPVTVNIDMNGSRVPDSGFGVYILAPRGIPFGPGLATSIPLVRIGGQAKVNLAAGTTYYLQLATHGSGGGELHLNVVEPPPTAPPPNDNFSSAIPLTTLPTRALLDASAATREIGEPTASCGQGRGTAWYSFTARESRSLNVGAFSDGTNALAIFTGTSLGNLREVRCARFSDPGGTVPFDTVAGTTYYFQLDGPGGQFTLDTTAAPRLVIESITDLGTLGGGFSSATGINDAGQVVGVSRLPNRELRAFLWQPNTGMVALPPIAEGNAEGRGINNVGQVVGSAAPGGAFLWQPGVGTSALGILYPENGGDSEASAINDGGTIVGRSLICGVRICPGHAFIREPRQAMRDLGTLGGADSSALAINRNNVVAGWSQTGFPGESSLEHHAFRWKDGEGMINLGSLAGGRLSEARGINDAGQITGWSEGGDGRRSVVHRPFLWDANSGMTDIGTLSAAGSAEANAINQAGQIVGVSDTQTPFRHAFLWRPGLGMFDLQSLDGGTSMANGLNNRLQVVGEVRRLNGETHAALWTLSLDASGRNHAPVAVCAANSGGGEEGAELVFSAEGSWDPDGDPLSYSWDFGDGARGSGLSALHAYSDNGAFGVVLTVNDGREQSSCRFTTTVRNVAPSVRVLGATILQGETYSESPRFSDPGADTWTGTANFGDGSPAEALSVNARGFSLSHVYRIPGVFTVTVVVTDKDGGVGTAQGRVTVQSFAEAIGNLKSLMPAAGLSNGNANSLIAKLQAAAAMISRGQAAQAKGPLGAFVEELDAMVNSGRLPADSARPLRDLAQRILRVLP